MLFSIFWAISSVFKNKIKFFKLTIFESLKKFVEFKIQFFFEILKKYVELKILNIYFEIFKNFVKFIFFLKSVFV